MRGNEQWSQGMLDIFWKPFENECGEGANFVGFVDYTTLPSDRNDPPDAASVLISQGSMGELLGL